MNTLKLQDAFEPYYEGRRGAFATIEASAVEKAKKLKERIEEIRKSELDRKRDHAA